VRRLTKSRCSTVGSSANGEEEKISMVIRSLAVELRRTSDDYLRDRLTTETYLKALARIIENYKRLVDEI